MTCFIRNVFGLMIIQYSGYTLFGSKFSKINLLLIVESAQTETTSLTFFVQFWSKNVWISFWSISIYEIGPLWPLRWSVEANLIPEIFLKRLYSRKPIKAAHEPPIVSYYFKKLCRTIFLILEMGCVDLVPVLI